MIIYINFCTCFAKEIMLGVYMICDLRIENLSNNFIYLLFRHIYIRYFVIYTMTFGGIFRNMYME